LGRRMSDFGIFGTQWKSGLRLFTGALGIFKCVPLN
jgi:hypothetical protein